MAIQDITTESLRKMHNDEGLILQGCGGEPQEWLDGINQMLTEDGILLDGTKFEDIQKFQNGDCTCLLFPFNETVKIDMEKLVIWRIKTHEQFGGTWLSDYVPNKLGGFDKAETCDESMDEGMQGIT